MGDCGENPNDEKKIDSPLQNLNDEIIYRQCMQTFLTPVSSPTRTFSNERKKQQNKNKTKKPNRSPGFFTTPRVIPESPEPKDKSIITITLPHDDTQHPHSVGGSKQHKSKRTTEEDNNDSDDSAELYMKAFNSYRKDFDESNAEASERHELIELKFRQLKREKKSKRHKSTHTKTSSNVMKTNNKDGDTQYQGPLTLLERQIIATKTQIALEHEDYDNIPVEYLIEGGDIFPKIWKQNFPLPEPPFLSKEIKNETNEKDDKIDNPQQNNLQIKLIEELKQYQKLLSDGRSSKKRPANITTILYGSCAHQ
jgi:hypothetical protein